MIFEYFAIGRIFYHIYSLFERSFGWAYNAVKQLFVIIFGYLVWKYFDFIDDFYDICHIFVVDLIPNNTIKAYSHFFDEIDL